MMQPAKSCKLFTSSSGSYKEKQQIILWQSNKKTSARKRVIRIIKDPENDIKSVNDKNADKVVEILSLR
jgi:hypothetical protein